MPVFRYDTRDVVRPIADEELSCEVSGLPATSKVLGKPDQLLRLGPSDVVTPRQLADAVEALPTQSWPARFRAVIEDGRIRLTLPESAVAGLGETAAAGHFADNGIDVDLRLVPDDEARTLRLLRCDLRETTFVARPALIGA
jgi:phenylacetate-CoA ligase